MAESAREAWRVRVQRWRDSGLTAGEFAAETGVNARTLAWWGSELRREQKGLGRRRREPKPRAKFVEVTAAVLGPGTGLEVVVGDVLVRVPVGFDEATLGRVLDLVRQK